MQHKMTKFESKASAETYWSVENNKQAIFSDEFRFRQNYRKDHRFFIWQKSPCGLVAKNEQKNLLKKPYFKA